MRSLTMVSRPPLAISLKAFKPTTTHLQSLISGASENSAATSGNATYREFVAASR